MEIFALILFVMANEAAISNCIDHSVGFDGYHSEYCARVRSRHDGIVGNSISRRDQRRG